MAVRRTVHVDKALLARARRFVPPRGFNRFVNDALTEKVSALEQARLAAEMRSGYLALAREASVQEEAADWDLVDTEGWPD